MRFLAVLGKFIRESLREWGILILALAFAPFFVAIFHVALGEAPIEYRLALVDEDRPAEGAPGHGPGLVAALDALGGEAGGLRIKVESFEGRGEALGRVREGGVDLLLVLPSDLTTKISAGEAPTFEFIGDMAGPKYALLLGLVYSAGEIYVSSLTGREGVISIRETSIRPESKMRPFDAMIPSLVVLSILTVLFTAAALFVREVEKGTIKRLRLSRLSTFEYLAAAGTSQLLVCLACVFLTIMTAMAFGYRLESSLVGLLLVASIASLSVIAFGLLTAAFCGSVKDVMIVGNFPYFFMLLFSGVMPIPSPTLLTIAGHPFGPSGFFPLSWGVKALEGMMNYGLGLGDLAFELAAMVLLTLAWFGLGLFLFDRKHLRA